MKKLECLIRLTRKNLETAEQFFYIENKIKVLKREFIRNVSNEIKYKRSMKFLNNELKIS